VIKKYQFLFIYSSLKPKHVWVLVLVALKLYGSSKGDWGSACIGFLVLWMDGCIVLSVETIGHARNGLNVLYNLISHKLVANFFENSIACLPVCFSYCTLLFAFVVEKGLEA
jgi:hypothetical protein